MKKTFTRNLQVGFGISLLLLILSSVASYISIQNLLQSAAMVDHSNEVVAGLENVMSTMKDAETGQRGYLLTGRADFLKPYNGAYQEALHGIRKAQTLTKHDPAQRQNIDRIEKILTTRLVILQQMLNRKRAGYTVSVDELRAGRESMDSLRRAVRNAEDQERRLLSSRTTTLKRSSGVTPIIIVIAAVLGIVVSLFSYIRMSADMTARTKLHRQLEEKEEEITHRINIIQDIASRVSDGDYTVRVQDDRKDDLGGVAVALNKMAASLERSFNQLTDNEWMQTGISQLNEQMIGDKPLSVLTSDILHFVTGYTRSQIGALYLRQGDTLYLQGTHALHGARQTIALGEGLVGQAAGKDEELWLKDIPETQVYMSLASGGLKPKSVLIMPIHFEKQVVGIVELASIYDYPERKLQFMRNVSSAVGIAVTSAESRRRMQELLEETQAQSEELQVQHSELENLNMELEAHTQKLQSSEEELRVQQEELQQSNQELEERNRIINQRNQEIQRKAEELEQSTRYKSEFMANMSHELRTPLNSILLLSRYLSENSEQNLNNDQIESAQVILNSGNGLLSLIDELLDLSKIEAGKMELEYQDVPITDLLSDMQSLFNPVAKEKGLSFLIENEAGVDKLETDRMRLEQVLKNLISNALKFTTAGQVKLQVRPSAITSGNLVFCVSDTGIGIPADKQGLIFEAFQQADGSTKRKFGGTGLGLSISRQLSRLLGGEITLQSESGKGSEFIVTVPVKRSASLPETSAPQAPNGNFPVVQETTVAKSKFIVDHIPEPVADDRHELSGTEQVILIIEDDTAFAKALLQFTRSQGLKGVVAVRGDDGIDLAQQFKPMAILLDIQLPVKDGWEVMEALKSDPQTRHIPVHMMSSLEAKRESRMRGAVDFINKPVAIEQMRNMFQKLQDALSRGPRKVLIVEENAKHAQALAYFLETFRISSTVAGNVDESVDALQNKEIDCVIMDMGIPDRNAYKTLETVKRNPGLEDLPIIVFTGKNLSTAEEGRIKQYADTIVVKTAHSYQRILDEVALFLHLVEENKEQPRETPSKLSLLDSVLKGKTVLIADDDIRNIFSLTKSLERFEMKVISAMDGSEALMQLEQHPETAIVLMDMMMPEMDGYESTARIRGNPKFKNIPVIAVTAKAMLGDREKCIAAGASDYISKPVDADQLISLLRVWLFQAQ